VKDKTQEKDAYPLFLFHRDVKSQNELHLVGEEEVDHATLARFQT
jgi:hypothetical protein